MNYEVLCVGTITRINTGLYIVTNPTPFWIFVFSFNNMSVEHDYEVIK